LRIALILCMRRTQGTVPNFTLEADEDALTLTLPKGWLDEHYLRASELRFEVDRQQKLGWPTRLLEA
ncbi:MAG: guanosine-5'-triphosphate,3'-diphosphate pyrophosphatase, partial [Aeromonas sp.]